MALATMLRSAGSRWSQGSSRLVSQTSVSTGMM